MSTPWFHAAQLPQVGEMTRLAPDEGRHAAGARRLGVGDGIVLFDGEGRTAEASVTATGAKNVIDATVSAIRTHVRRQPALWLAAALPKGDRQSSLLSMATELGLDALVPLEAQRSVARVGRGSAARWERITLAACKQSRRPWRPRFEAPVRPGDAARALAPRGPCFVLHPDPDAPLLGSAVADSTGCATALERISLIVGPEGGFTESEISDCAAAGAVVARIGPSILRIETAAVAGLALLTSLG